MRVDVQSVHPRANRSKVILMSEKPAKNEAASSEDGDASKLCFEGGNQLQISEILEAIREANAEDFASDEQLYQVMSEWHAK